MELDERKLEGVLGGANPDVIDQKVAENKEVFRSSSDGELSEKDLEGVYAGPNREAMIDKALENDHLFREEKLDEIEKEKKELLMQREEILKRGTIKEKEEELRGGKIM